MLDLFANYLADRTQHVRIGNIISDPATVQFGVPQGTVMGPILLDGGLEFIGWSSNIGFSLSWKHLKFLVA